MDQSDKATRRLDKLRKQINDHFSTSSSSSSIDRQRVGVVQRNDTFGPFSSWTTVR